MAFWQSVANGISRGERIPIIAENVEKKVVMGAVQIVHAQAENQPHRADIAKMLVHARRQGIGTLLMCAAEEEARAAGKTLLVLDTETGSDAEKLYKKIGLEKVGEIPKYAMRPDGQMSSTSYYYKFLV